MAHSAVRADGLRNLHIRQPGKGKGKGKVHPYNRSRMPRGGVEVQPYSFFNLGDRWGGWSTPRPCRFNPGITPLIL